MLNEKGYQKFREIKSNEFFVIPRSKISLTFFNQGNVFSTVASKIIFRFMSIYFLKIIYLI